MHVPRIERLRVRVRRPAQNRLGVGPLPEPDVCERQVVPRANETRFSLEGGLEALDACLEVSAIDSQQAFRVKDAWIARPLFFQISQLGVRRGRIARKAVCSQQVEPNVHVVGSRRNCAFEMCGRLFGISSRPEHEPAKVVIGVEILGVECERLIECGGRFLCAVQPRKYIAGRREQVGLLWILCARLSKIGERAVQLPEREPCGAALRQRLDIPWCGLQSCGGLRFLALGAFAEAGKPLDVRALHGAACTLSGLRYRGKAQGADRKHDI